MAEQIVRVTDGVCVGAFLLWMLGYAVGLIPRLCAERIARREGEVSKNEIRYAPFYVAQLLLVPLLLILPMPIRLLLLGNAGGRQALLVPVLLFEAIILFHMSSPRLRYDDKGIYVRGDNGKDYFVPFTHIVAVEWSFGGRRARKTPPKRLRPPVLVIRYRSPLLGKSVKGTVVLSPAEMVGIRRFLEAWEAHRREAASRGDA